MGPLPGHIRGGHKWSSKPRNHGRWDGSRAPDSSFFNAFFFSLTDIGSRLFYFIWPCFEAWGILDPQSEIELGSSAVDLTSGPPEISWAPDSLTWTVWPKTHLPWNLGWLDVSNGLCTCCILVHATWLILWVNVVAFPHKAKLCGILSILAEKIGQKKGGMTGSAIDFWHMS